MSVKLNRKGLRWAVAAVLCVVLCVCLCFGVACSKTNENAQGSEGYFTKTDPGKTKPEEGYSGNEYVNYVAYVLEQQTEWYAVSDSQAKASVNNQQIWTDKYYKDGYMLTTQKSYSAFSKEAFQAVFVTGRQGSADEERGVYLRDGSKPKNKDHDFSDVTWDDGEPTYYLEEDYYYLHGLFSDEMSVFIINDETIEKADAVVKNSDGTYSQHFVLDTDDSVYYYQYSMKNHGGLSTFPAFEQVEVTMTFNESFELLKLETTEQSKVRKAGSNWTNKTTATTTYTYPGMEEEENFNGKNIDTIWKDNEKTLSEATSYFDEYYGTLEANTNREIIYTPDASDVLMGALSGALTSDGETYRMEITYDGMTAGGYLFAAIDLEAWDDLTFDFSDFGIMDWVTFAMEAYEYAHIIVEVDDDEGNQAIVVDLLNGGDNLLTDLMEGRIIEVYLGVNALSAGVSDTDVEDILAMVYTVMAEALVDGDATVESSGDVEMNLEYGPLTRPATVTLDMDGFYMLVDCIETVSYSDGEVMYDYELIQATIEIPSIGLDIVLTPVLDGEGNVVSDDEKLAKVTPSDDLSCLGLETLVGDLVNTAMSALDFTSPYYITDTYTISGDISFGISSMNLSIEIDNFVVTVGDVFDDLYISFVGDLQECKYIGMTVADASTIGLTWYGDYIVMARDLETATPTYRVYTTDSFVDMMLDSDSDVSPIAWLLGTGSVAWGIVAGLFDVFTGSDDTEANEKTKEGETLTTQSLLEWLNLGQYLSSAKVKLGGETLADIGDFDVEEAFGLTDNYWAFELGEDFMSSVTAGYVGSTAVAITQSMSQLSGIYVAGSVFGILDLTLNLSTIVMGDSEVYDLFEGNLNIDLENNDTLVVPNLYYVFVDGMSAYGVSESAFDFSAVSSTEMEVKYTVGGYEVGGYVIGGTEYTVNTSVSGTVIIYEYTVGDSTYTTYYGYEATVKAEDDTESDGATVSGTFSETAELPNPPVSSGKGDGESGDDE